MTNGVSIDRNYFTERPQWVGGSRSSLYRPNVHSKHRANAVGAPDLGVKRLDFKPHTLIRNVHNGEYCA